MNERSSPVSGILALDVSGWTLSVRVHDGGYEVSITEDGKRPASHYVRLDSEQADTLRDFMVETSPTPVEAARASEPVAWQLLREARQYVFAFGNDEDGETQNNSINLLSEIDALLSGDVAQPSREAVIEECARVAESYPSSGEQTEHPVEYWIRRLSIPSTDRGGK